MALFRLIHGGSLHGVVPVRAYGGAAVPARRRRRATIRSPGRCTSWSTPSRSATATIHAVLRKLLRGPLPVMRGRQKTFVEGPVDYTDLRTEFIGLIYEGLLDYRIKRTDAEIGPQVFLNIGREPVLPLRRLEDMLAHDRNGLKNLLTTLGKEKVTATVASEEEDEADEEAEDAAEDQDEAAEEAEAVAGGRDRRRARGCTAATTSMPRRRPGAGPGRRSSWPGWSASRGRGRPTPSTRPGSKPRRTS